MPLCETATARARSTTVVVVDDHHAIRSALVLSASDRLDDLRAALHAGANGFLSKSAPMPVLVDGIRRTAAGQQVISSELVYALSKRVEAPVASRRRSSMHRRKAAG